MDRRHLIKNNEFAIYVFHFRTLFLGITVGHVEEFCHFSRQYCRIFKVCETFSSLLEIFRLSPRGEKSLYSCRRTINSMETIKVQYRKGVFQPLKRIVGFQEGQIVEITIKEDTIAEMAMKGNSFDFLEKEEDIYSEKDIID